MKRLFASFLCIGVLLSSFNTAFAENGGAERTVYQSSENFSIETADGTWDGGVWSAQLIDPETDEMSVITGTVELRDGMGADAEQAAAYQASAGGQAISAYRVMPAPRNNVENFTFNAAKVFTAPRAGEVTITCGGDKIQTSDGSGPSVRIRKLTDGEFTQIWPASGLQKLSWSGFNGKHDDITLTLNEGDKLCFEGLRNTNGKDHMWSFIYWDPIVTYKADETPDTPDEPPAPEDRDKFLSSEYFNIKAADGTWDSGVWAAEIVDPETDEILPITGTTDARDGMGANAEQAAAYQTSAGGHAVSAYRITPSPRNNVENFSFSAAKVFNAPKDGRVIISCGEDKIQTSDGSGPSVRIRKLTDGEFKQVWPSSGSQKLGWAAFNGKHDDITLTLSKGDKLYFEGLRNINGKDHLWSNIYWDPKITYQSGGDEPDNPDVPEDDGKAEYMASDSFSLTKNGDNVWKWQYYSIAEKEYKNLEYTNTQLPIFAKDLGLGPAWTSMDGSNRGVAVGQYGMRCSVLPDTATAEEQTMKIVRDYAVRTFTSNKRGEITISAEDGVIEHANEVNGTHLRILQHVAATGETKQIWPSESWENVKGRYSFEPIDISIGYGDKLTFENAFWWKQMGASPWNTAIHWNPIVKFNRVYPILVNAATADGALDVPLNNEFKYEYDKNITTINAEDIEVFTVDENGSQTAAADVTVESRVDGKKLNIKFDGLKPYTEYAVTVNGLGYAEGDEGVTTAEKFRFTTGPEVNTEEITFENGKVTAKINNPAAAPKRAALFVLVCRGAENKYSVVNAYYTQRSDIGANDSLSLDVDIPDGCFIKALLTNGITEAQPYRRVCIIRKGE